MCYVLLETLILVVMLYMTESLVLVTLCYDCKRYYLILEWVKPWRLLLASKLPVNAV